MPRLALPCPAPPRQAMPDPALPRPRHAVRACSGIEPEKPPTDHAPLTHAMPDPALPRPA
jgi:hypothetical protein